MKALSTTKRMNKIDFFDLDGAAPHLFLARLEERSAAGASLWRSSGPAFGAGRSNCPVIFRFVHRPTA
jgi:hypothetical protein